MPEIHLDMNALLKSRKRAPKHTFPKETQLALFTIQLESQLEEAICRCGGRAALATQPHTDRSNGSCVGDVGWAQLGNPDNKPSAGFKLNPDRMWVTPKPPATEQKSAATSAT